MGIFRKLIVGLKRTFRAKSLDYVSEQKSYGNDAEFVFGSEIGKYLPSCKIKSAAKIQLLPNRQNASTGCSEQINCIPLRCGAKKVYTVR